MIDRWDNPESPTQSIEGSEAPVAGPITACVADEDSLNLAEESIDWADKTEGRPIPVDFYSKEKALDALGQKHAGESTYVISAVDASNKHSLDYFDCLGLCAIGREGAKNVSLLTHHSSRAGIVGTDEPPRFRALSDQFIVDLTERMKELATRTKPGTVDVVIFGGSETFLDDYKENVRKIGAMSSEILGVDPAVIVGPKDLGGRTSIVCDTQKRRLYITQPSSQLPESQKNWNRDASFKASEIDTKTAE